MRILSTILICLLIVTLAVGVDAARDRGSKDSNQSSASSSDSKSSDRHSDKSNDRQSTSSSNSSDRHSSSSSSESSRPSYSPYHPNTSDSGSSRTANESSHNTYSGSRQNTGTQDHSVYQHNQQSNQPTVEAAPTTRTIRDRQLAEARTSGSNAYRPTTTTTRTGYYLDRSADSSSKPTGYTNNDDSGTNNHGRNSYTDSNRPRFQDNSSADAITPDTSQQPAQELYPTTRYNRDQKMAEARTANQPDQNKTDHNGYRPNTDSASSNHDGRFSGRTDNRAGDRTDNQNHSAYRPDTGNHSAPAEMRTTRSSRDQKLAEARMSATVAYRPVVSRNHFTYADYKAPKGYHPPSYREGRYYYSHPHYTRPCSFGFWSLDYYSGFCRRSLYFHYGLFPYVEVTRIIVDDYPTVVYVDQPIYSITGIRYENDRYPGLDEALGDIRSAWTSGRFDLVQKHVRDGYDIAILLDGKYDYSVTASDYLAMTEDALGEMQTDRFVWDKVQCRRDGTITAFATHTYWSGNSTRKVYVSYTLQRVGSRYYIVEVGSTQVPWN